MNEAYPFSYRWYCTRLHKRKRKDTFKSVYVFEKSFHINPLNPPNNLMGLWWAQTSRWKPESLRLGQLIFSPLGFLHINIDYILLFWLRQGLDCRKWQRFRFSHHLAAQFGSGCRAAGSLDSCTSVALISVILSRSAHETPD